MFSNRFNRPVIHFGRLNMRTTYNDEDDILVLHLSDKPIKREVSQDWNTHISYAEGNTVVVIVVIDAAALWFILHFIATSKKLGAEIIRLWVAASDYAGDIAGDDKILARVVDTYRRIRNTI